MRRKSERNKGKSPEPAAKSEKPKRGRPSRKRRKSSSSAERESGSDEGSQENPEVLVQTTEPAPSDKRESEEANCDDESEPVWQVKKSESSGDSSEIQKLKICLARPPSTPERADRSPRGKKRSSHSSVDTLSDTGEEKRKSRRKRRNSSKEATTGEDASESEEQINKPDTPIEEKDVVEKPHVDCEASQEDAIPADSVSEVNENKTTEQSENEIVEDITTHKDDQKEELPVTTVSVTSVEYTPVQEDSKVEVIADGSVKEVCPGDSQRSPGEVNDNAQVQEEHSDVHVEEKVVDAPDDNKTPIPDKTPQDHSKEDRKTEDIISTKPEAQIVETLDSHNDSVKDSSVSEDIVAGKIVLQEHTAETGSVRKRRWGSRSSKISKTSTVSISTDSLKNLIPKVEPVSVEDVLLEVKSKEETQIEKIVVEDKVKPNGKYNNIHDKPKEREILGSVTHRKISVMSDDIPKEQRSPSPPKHKSSSILYISNLVRPFTLPQLKNLLLRTGKIVENGFWIDKIKSRCYVQYQTEDEAIETRHALHGVTWPVSNPKTLVVDFSSESAMRDAMDSNDDDKIIISTESRGKEQNAKENDFRRDTEIYEKRMVIREWDVGKGDNINRDMRDDGISRIPGQGYLRDQPDGDRNDKRKRRSKSPSPARKFKKKEDEAPSKLLDDLFRKTKATPCIYWLPLNAETILIKEEQRRKHMAEHEKRMEELRRVNEEQRSSRHTYHASNRHR